MKQILRAFLFLLLFTATVNTAIADEKANVTKQGTVRGRIIDATKQTLPGASIYIEKLHTGVTSDVNGFYTFSNLDPGTYTVKVSYVGYSPVELKITIPAGRTLEKDVVLNEGGELQEVVVRGAFQGQRRAINSQKNNMGITNVVSADQVGKFPDSNIERKHLYTPDQLTTSQYFEDTPAIFPENDAPGNIGTWIGWQIINQYMKETGSTPEALMQNNDAQEILTASKYKPL